MKETIEKTRLWKFFSLVGAIVSLTLAVVYFFVNEKKEIDEKQVDLIASKYENEIAAQNMEIARLEKELSILGKDCEFEKKLLGNENNALEKALERYRKDSSVNQDLDTVASSAYKSWIGTWMVSYGSTFEHSLRFYKDDKNKLKGDYRFDETQGEIDVSFIDDKILKGKWVQYKNEELESNGTYTFMLDSPGKFTGSYSRSTDNVETLRVWNGKKKR